MQGACQQHTCHHNNAMPVMSHFSLFSAGSVGKKHRHVQVWEMYVEGGAGREIACMPSPGSGTVREHEET